MPLLLNALRIVGNVIIAILVMSVLFSPMLLVAAPIVGIFDLLFLDLVWMSWPTFWWILGTAVVLTLIMIVGKSDKIMFGFPW
ncbi:hypothetical protein ACR0ST_08715 [Aliidiomarina sp. Khilg15.8]